MKPELETLCTDFIANRDTVKNAFRWDNAAVMMGDAKVLPNSSKEVDGDVLFMYLVSMSSESR